MSATPTIPFAAASLLAERFLEYLDLVEHLAAGGKADDAAVVADAIVAYAGVSELYDALESSRGDLCAVAESHITTFTRSGKRVTYESAHRAVQITLLTIQALGDHDESVAGRLVRPDLREWLGVDTGALLAYVRREREKVLRLGRTGGFPTPAPAVPELVDDGKVRLPDGRTLALGRPGADVLGALLDLGGAAVKSELAARSGYPDPGRELKRLARRFPELAPHITLPGGKSKGGYGTTIRDSRPPSSPRP